MCTVRPKLGVFSKLSKYSFFCCFITWLVKKLQQWSLYEVVEDILPFIFDTKRPLSDIWLLSYKQNNFGSFWGKKCNSDFFQKDPKLFCLYLSNQILLRGCFVFKTNGRISSINSYKDHCCSFFTSWVIKQQTKLYIEHFEKTPKFGCMVDTPKIIFRVLQIISRVFKSQFSGTTFLLVVKFYF